jgi:dTDP-4-amino-4,6-dideoxygalactose transaminase
MTEPRRGGAPSPWIPVARPLLGQPEVRAAERVLLSGWVTQGPEVAAFENEFADYAGAGHACAVSSGTTALHLGLLAAGVGPGDEVVTVSHSFIATANAVRYCGAKPVFVDIRPDQFNIDPSLIESVVTERTRAILCVHQIGMPCDLAPILEIARRRGLRVIEDAACALGSEVLLDGRWEKIGRPYGDVACFSLHPRKAITTGDGGMLTTSNREWDTRFRRWRQHGMSVPDTARHAAPSPVFESYEVLGFNYRMTDIQAAIGREQLKRLPSILERRRRQVEVYHRLLADLSLTLPREPAWARSNWQSFCVRLPARCDQREVMQVMLDRGVATRRGVMCAHREPAYGPGTWSCGIEAACPCRPGRCARLVQSEEAQDHCIILPLFHELTEDAQAIVASSLAEALLAAAR